MSSRPDSPRPLVGDAPRTQFIGICTIEYPGWSPASGCAPAIAVRSATPDPTCGGWENGYRLDCFTLRPDAATQPTP